MSVVTQEPYRWSARGVAAVLCASALSISLSQLLLGATTIIFAIEALLAYRQRQTLRRQDSAPTNAPGADTHEDTANPGVWILLVGGALFGWLLVSLVVHLIQDGAALQTFRRAAARELSDLPLYLFSWMVMTVARRPAHQVLLVRAFVLFSGLVIAGGVLAMFSEFRLAKIAMGAGKAMSATNRPQHPFGTVFGLTLYRPIGFMNTRLTYAGLLLLAIVPLPVLARAPSFFIGGAPDTRGNHTKTTRALLWLMAGVGAVVLFVNGTRSAWIGLAGAVALAILGPMTAVAKRYARLMLPIGGLGLMAVLLALSPVAHPLQVALKNRVLRYTDAQRPMLWSSAIDLTIDAPFFGVGPGNFPEAQRRWRQAYTTRNPETLYWVHNAPDGHAHNDILHLAAVGGAPAALLFALLVLLLMMACQRRSGRDLSGTQNQHLASGLLLGCVALVPAGLFQAYFQDDEVVIVFWILCGMAAGLLGTRPKQTAGKPRQYLGK